MKLRLVCRKVYDYVRYDLKEIAFPSSLPDPPHIKKRRKLTWKERWYALKEASRLYGASWVRDIGPELRPNDYKRKADEDGNGQPHKATSDKSEPSVVLEDLAASARGGMETLKPVLQRMYNTRASVYRDTLEAFVKSYQQRLAEVLEEEKKKGQSGDNALKQEVPKKSP